MQGLLTRATGKEVMDSRAARPLLKPEKCETRQAPQGEAQRQTSSPPRPEGRHCILERGGHCPTA